MVLSNLFGTEHTNLLLLLFIFPTILIFIVFIHLFIRFAGLPTLSLRENNTLTFLVELLGVAGYQEEVIFLGLFGVRIIDDHTAGEAVLHGGVRNHLHLLGTGWIELEGTLRTLDQALV